MSYFKPEDVYSGSDKVLGDKDKKVDVTSKYKIGTIPQPKGLGPIVPLSNHTDILETNDNPTMYFMKEQFSKDLSKTIKDKET